MPGYPLSPAQRRLLALSDERDRWLRRVLASWREGWHAGYQAGYQAGLAVEPEPLDVSPPAPWPEAIDPELDRRRYPPGGRRSWMLTRDRAGAA